MRSFERVSAGYQRHLDAVASGCAVYDDKIIPIDAPSAALAGQLEAKGIAAGFDQGMTTR
jgi:hypothetical protein